MRFVWFLSFWSWSRESHRAGFLLRHPLEGIAGNWDEWFTGEASAAERVEIDLVGQRPDFQVMFAEWLEQVWIRDAAPNDNRLALTFVRSELARVAPFKDWSSFATFRTSPTAGPILAVVLGGESEGRAEDLRPVQAILLPLTPPASDRRVVADGFQAEATDLNVARESALRLMQGSGGRRLLTRWIATGRRPYPGWLKAILSGGWLWVGLLLAWLWFGPDPGASLRPLAAVLVGLWSTLMLVAVGGAGVQVFRARRAGRAGVRHLTHDQVRLHLPGRFTLKGGSAGLPFTLGMLQAVGRAYPDSLSSSWLWRQFADALEAPGAAWAATGVVGTNGQVQPVELAAKLRACLRSGRVRDLIAPAQREAKADALQTLRNEIGAGSDPNPVDAPPAVASDRAAFRIHRCRHVADAVLTVARLKSTGQTWLNIFALLLSGVMMVALPDLRCILLPPPAPVVIPPSSPSPYFLWVSLNTRHPRFFQVVLESSVWANRRVDVEPRRSLPASVRAEIRLVRLSQSPGRDLQDGVVWIERRPCLLNRRYQPGEVVGRYTVIYLNRLHHE